MKKKISDKILLIILTVFCSILCFSTNVSAVEYRNGQIKAPGAEGTVMGNANVPTVANSLYGQMSVFLNGFVGIALITLTIIFVIRCGQLGASADNAQKRSQSIGGLLWVGIAIGGLGFFSAVGGIMTIITQMTNGSFLN